LYNAKIILFSDVVELHCIPRIRISGLIENTKKEMLAMYFEHEKRNGGGKVKNIEMDQKGKFATIDFEEKEGTYFHNSIVTKFMCFGVC
jgi:hypothetical protein